MLSRRALFHSLACGCLAAPGVFAAREAFAADPVPKTTLTPDQVLAKLKEGNAAFVKGGACIPAGGPARISELAKGQAPFAVIVACSDSRTPPEHLFERGLGELFVVRVAGNVVDRSALGSIEYGVAVLGAPLVLILGHSKCGAVEAASKVVTEGATYPGAIGELIAPIIPSVLAAQRAKADDVVSGAIRANVARVVEQLRASEAILANAVKSGKAKVTGGVYDLQSGAVDFMA